MQPNLKLKYAAIVVVLLSGPFCVPANAALSLDKAEAIALKQDPVVSRLAAESRSLSEQSIADGQWKDPRLKLGLIAIPTDSFDLNQENMTQQQIGFQQIIPRGDSLALKQSQTRSKAEQKNRKMDLERQTIRRDVRLAYLDVVYQKQAYGIVKKSKLFFEQLEEIAQFRYSSGKEKKQLILEASLTHSRMEDRLLKITDMEKKARAKLSKWVGNGAAFEEILPVFPEFDDLPDQEVMHNRLSSHPAIRVAEAKINTRSIGVQLAKEQYKPAWMADATYGRRQDSSMGRSRADLLSVMVSIDLPLFTKNRQDRVHNAQRIEVEAAQYERDDKLRMLESQLEINRLNLEWTLSRIKLFSFKLMPEALNYTQTTLTGYQSGVTDLTAVVRAHLAELTVRLDRLKLQHTERASHAKLLYLIGEQE
ncbi:MAG: TolC family protein [Magnetococcales bacterium]|nr:TolC family protein [Magnetococcales bacterium]